MKKHDGWMLKHWSGAPELVSLKADRWDAIYELLGQLNLDVSEWQYLEMNGYRCVKVKLVEVEQ